MDIRKYIYSHCAFPKKMQIYDAVQGHKVTRFVPCGTCLHCKNQHISEWTTRLYAHSLYVKNVYYITLDYAPFDENNATAMLLAADTAAVHNDINKYHTYGLQPILLCRAHLQKFFKRLRKSTNKTFQYFACGEYGHLYSRPHFHIILFSDDTFTDSDIQSAWTLDGYKIGNVDFHDLRQNGTFIKNSLFSPKYVFSYVCKYLQKSSFNVEEIKTIDYWKQYFNSQQVTLAETDTLFPSVQKITDSYVLNQNWQAFVRVYSPFVCCSKRPSIGLSYFKENVQRFQTQDFRLFGLPKECVSFPMYWIRKTKESLCCYQVFGDVSHQPSSNSRLGSLISILREIRDVQNSIESWTDCPPSMWCADGTKIVLKHNNEDAYSIDNLNLSFYDNDNKLFYFFTGFDYNIKQKVRKLGYVSLGSISIDDTINMLSKSWFPYYDNFLKSMDYKQKVSELEFEHSKSILFPNSNDIDVDFKNLVYNRYIDELRNWNIRKQLINNTKIKF